MPTKTDDVPLKAPRRPLSAYNFFFQDQRAKLLAGDKNETEEDAGNKKRKHRKAHGKIGFTALARHVGAAWKSLGAQEKSEYEQRFKEDKVRYAKELEEYEEKLSSLIHLAQVKRALQTIRAQEAQKEAKKQEEEEAAVQAHILSAQSTGQSFMDTGAGFANILQQAIDLNGVHHSGEAIRMDGTPRIKRRCSLDRSVVVPETANEPQSGSLTDSQNINSMNNHNSDYHVHSNAQQNMHSYFQQGMMNSMAMNPFAFFGRRMSAPWNLGMMQQNHDLMNMSIQQTNMHLQHMLQQSAPHPFQSPPIAADMDNILPIPLSNLDLNHVDQNHEEDSQGCEIFKNVINDLSGWDDDTELFIDVDISAAFDSPSKDEEAVGVTETPPHHVVPPSPPKSDQPLAPVDDDTLSFLQEFIYDDSLFV